MSYKAYKLMRFLKIKNFFFNLLLKCIYKIFSKMFKHKMKTKSDTRF